jgi:pyruvate, water dikinase
VRWLDGYDPADRARLGGKNASLGELLAAGLPVPPGFAVTTDAYHITLLTARRQEENAATP